jgi:hypothetical protein
MKNKLNHSEYRYIYFPDHPFSSKGGLVAEHRLIWEKYYNVCLLPWIDIHHKDYNKLNNDINNLQALSRIEHMKLHKGELGRPKIDMKNRFCLFCHSTKTYIKPNGRPYWVSYNNGNICSYCYILFIRKII